jgi:hypothetical protein
MLKRECGDFVELGVPEEYSPHVQVYESYPGSWIIEAAITISASVGTSYVILKSVSELPQIADGLEELKTRFRKETNGAANEAAREMLRRGERSKLAPVVPNEVINTDLIIDARPLRALTPERMRDHKIHLSVGISRGAFTLENLGDEPLRDIRIGLFCGAEARHHWYFGDAYVGMVSLLSAHQTITRQLSTFQHNDGGRLDLEIVQPVFLDC